MALVDLEEDAVIVPVIWPARDPAFLARGYADCALLEAVMDRTLWTPQNAITFEHIEVREESQWPVAGGLVIFNGRANKNDADWLIKMIAGMPWSVVIITGDEEHEFPWPRIPESKTRRVWVMQPDIEQSFLSYMLPGGWYPNTREELVKHYESARSRTWPWFFAGQVTHQRRVDCFNQLVQDGRGKAIRTGGFMEGVDNETYMAFLADSKVVPCPSGPVTVDTARPLSALEAGCVPVLDARRTYGEQFDYWSLIFGKEHPFPEVYEWREWPYQIDTILPQWAELSNKCSAFWQRWKRQTALQLDADIREVSGRTSWTVESSNRITAIITTSPIPSNPSTEMIGNTISSIREQLPLAEIIIAIDGVRPEQKDQKSDYNEYVRDVLWRCNFEWHNVLPVVLPEWGHQANAVRRALEYVNTETILFVEHDTPILGDIDWCGIINNIESGLANAVRLHQDIEIHPDHERIILDPQAQMINGVPMRRTSAWWQRPHIAATDFYRDMLDEFFPLDSRTMIEDRMYSPVFIDCTTKREGWGRWRLWVFTPDGDIRRSGHFDGRGEQPKYGMDFGGKVTDESSEDRADSSE